jgi:hypothetical protein
VQCVTKRKIATDVRGSGRIFMGENVIFHSLGSKQMFAQPVRRNP